MRSPFALLSAALLIIAMIGCTKEDTPPASSSTPPVNQERVTTGGQPIPTPTAPETTDPRNTNDLNATNRTDVPHTKDNAAVKNQDHVATPGALPRAKDTTTIDADDRDRDLAQDSDNTGTNTRDRDGAHLTPLDQGSSDSDLAITQSIRQAVVDEDEMSINAQNVKIITKDGVVTLRGPVATAAERAAIETLAQRTAGVTRVDNQLEITTP